MKKYLLLLLTISCFASSSLVAMKKKDMPKNLFGSNQGGKDGKAILDQAIGESEEVIKLDTSMLDKVGKVEKEFLLTEIHCSNKLIEILTDIKKELMPKSSFGTNQGISVKALNKCIVREYKKIENKSVTNKDQIQNILKKKKLTEDEYAEVKEIRLDSLHNRFMLGSLEILRGILLVKH